MKGVRITKFKISVVRKNEVIKIWKQLKQELKKNRKKWLKLKNSLNGGPDWTRTNDFHHVKVTLYQLSYGAKKKRQYIKKISQ